MAGKNTPWATFLRTSPQTQCVSVSLPPVLRGRSEAFRDILTALFAELRLVLKNRADLLLEGRAGVRAKRSAGC